MSNRVTSWLHAATFIEKKVPCSRCEGSGKIPQWTFNKDIIKVKCGNCNGNKFVLVKERA